jgi:glycerol-3-phosphate acyltransferase PlsY
MHPAFGLVPAYLSGSFPTAYLAGRLLKGIDLRTKGSGNLGATNVYRNLGAGAALVVLVLDALKGALPVYLIPRVLHIDAANGGAALWWASAYGIAAIVGHAKPVFLLGRGGGKGVATAGGVFAVLAPHAMVITTLLCALAVWYTGYVSVGSVVAALAFPALVWIEYGTSSPLFSVSLTVSAFIVWAHKSNLRRLREGTEQALFRKWGRRP